MKLSSKEKIRAAGLMTGTSMDGLDIVIADICLNENVKYKLIGDTFIPYPNNLKQKIRYAVYNPLKDHYNLDDNLGKWYADTLYNYLQSNKKKIVVAATFLNHKLRMIMPVSETLMGELYASSSQ